MTNGRLSDEWFTENTLFKVYDALRKAGLGEIEAREAIAEMQNVGVLFRERITRDRAIKTQITRGPGSFNHERVLYVETLVQKAIAELTIKAGFTMGRAKDAIETLQEASLFPHVSQD